MAAYYGQPWRSYYENKFHKYYVIPPVYRKFYLFQLIATNLKLKIAVSYKHTAYSLQLYEGRITGVRPASSAKSFWF